MSVIAHPEQAFTERARGLPWGLVDVLIAIAVLAGAIVLSLASIVAPAWAIFGKDSIAGRTATALSTLVFEVIAAAVVYRLLLKPKGVRLRDLGFRAPLTPDGRRSFRLSWLGLVLGAWLFALLILMGYVWLVTAAGAESLEPPEEQIPSELFSHWIVIIALGASVMVGAPLFEELFFRGFVFPALAKSFGFIPGALGSGLLFGLSHMDVGFIVPFAAIGMWFAYLYRRTDSLYTTILCHFLFNFVAFSALVATEA
ncbi:MAG TPA: CPBP family intramembrane glutamic endopeptidase [Dehalococcoidia bacterium]|nr:CPBP family intramembrane glutamic endopeptidase [Dehalococcoidia bacterium]